MNYNKLRLLALDPASKITGYAYFEESPPIIIGGEAKASTFLMQYGLIKAKGKETFDLRCLEINSKIRNFIVEKQVTRCVMEYPQFQAGSRGNNAARQGDTLILAFLCGSIAVGWQFHVAQVMKEEVLLPLASLIRPSEWKGQCTKEITAARCLKKYDVTASKLSEYNYTDAIMIGDYALKSNGIEGCNGSFMEKVDF